MPKSLGGRPRKYDPIWRFCFSCKGWTKHYYNKSRNAYKCGEPNHSERTKIVLKLFR